MILLQVDDIYILVENMMPVLFNTGIVYRMYKRHARKH